MDKVKAALTDFTSKAGHHDTTVHEKVAPAVQHETIKPHQHESVNTAVDREVHQDHYHRTVQPVQHREVLPETHTAKLGEVQHREFDHRDHDHTKRHLEQDQALFKDQQKVDATTHSRSVAPTVGGEHVHHHIHETIQPVVHKETVQPNVVHTTVPIHEVHHNKATHHDTTSLPAMTLDQFQQKGGVLSGREERFDHFNGVPKNIGGGVASGVAANGFGVNEHSHKKHDSHHLAGEARHGDYESVPHHGTSGHHEKSGLTGTHNNLTNTTGTHEHHPHHTSTHDHTSTRDHSTSHDHSSSRGPNPTSSTNDAAGQRLDIDPKHAKADLSQHRPGESAELPKALTEDKSHAVPHSSLKDGHHGEVQREQHKDHLNTERHATVAEKLKPNVDADGDGKAGVLD